MFYNSLIFKKNQESVFLNILLSKLKFTNIKDIPRLKKVKLFFFFKNKRFIFNFKMIFLMLAICAKVFKIFKSKLKFRAVLTNTKTSDVFGLLYLFYVWKPLFNFSNIHCQPKTHGLHIFIKNLRPLFLLFESVDLEERLVKHFSLQILLLFSKKNLKFQRLFLQLLF